MMRWVAAGLLLLGVAAARGEVASGKVWPGFRGDGSSRTAARDLPLRWSATENVAWQAELPGYGQSSPSVWNDRVFVTSVSGATQERLHLRSFSLADGKPLWSHDFPASQTVQTSDYVSKAAPTPVADAERLYVFWESGDLAALSHEGKVLWQRSLSREFGPIRGNHGLGTSPVLIPGGLALLLAHDGGSYLLAVDRATGKDLWKRDHPFSTSWTTPLLTDIGGKPLLVASTSGKVEAFDARSGAPVWSVGGLKGNTVPSPSVEDGVAVIGSSERGHNLAVRLDGEGDVTGTHVAWRSESATTSFGSPLVYRGRIYMVNRAGVAACLDLKSGQTLWEMRLPASAWASPLAAGDRVYLFSTDGSALVVREGAALEKLAENRFPVEGRVYGVAAVDGALLFRAGSRLVRLGK